MYIHCSIRTLNRSLNEQLECIVKSHAPNIFRFRIFLMYVQLMIRLNGFFEAVQTV